MVVGSSIVLPFTSAYDDELTVIPASPVPEILLLTTLFIVVESALQLYITIPIAAGLVTVLFSISAYPELI